MVERRADLTGAATALRRGRDIAGRGDGGLGRGKGKGGKSVQPTNAQRELRRLLEQVGLDGLADRLWDEVIKPGLNNDQFLIWLREQDEFRERFAGIFDREQEGLPPLVPGGGLAEQVRAHLE